MEEHPNKTFLKKSKKSLLCLNSDLSHGFFKVNQLLILINLYQEKEVITSNSKIADLKDYLNWKLHLENINEKYETLEVYYNTVEYSNFVLEVTDKKR